jgi:hypothetical protein
MESQVFNPDSYSLRPTDLIDDGDTDTDTDVRWAYYCETASQLDPTDLLEIAVDELKTEDSPLLEAIEDAIRYPYEPGRAPKVNASDALRLGKAIIAIVARIVDDQVSMIQAGEVSHASR